MGTTYSISRIGTFESCRLKYKYAYIDRLEAEEETIEAFLGRRVHEALQEFYNLVKNRVVEPKEWLLAKYDELWQKNFTDSIKIVKKELRADDYYRKGRSSLSDHYDEHHPFDRTKVINTEEQIYFKIRQGDAEYAITGVIDRIDWDDKAKRFEIHDYKTSGSLMTQDEADSDDQLTLYQMALLQKWPDATNARLVWHYLLFNKQIESSRTAEQLQEFQKDLIERISEIETCTDFEPRKSALCEWCGFQQTCPLWKHPKQMEKLEVNEYKKDPGVVLVQKYADFEEKKLELKEKIAEIEAEQAKIEEAAIGFAEKEGIRVIDGPGHQLAISIKEEIGAPTKKEDELKWRNLRETLLAEGKFIEVATINSNMLNSRLRSWPKDFYAKIKDFLIKRVTRRVDLRKK